MINSYIWIANMEIYKRGGEESIVKKESGFWGLKTNEKLIKQYGE